MSETKRKMQKKLMDMISRRTHSEKELRTKLIAEFGEAEDASEAVEAAIQHAKDQRWLEDPAEIAARTAKMLHEKQKGIEYINQYLEEKGLPTVNADSDLELEKALDLVKNKYREAVEFDDMEKAKVARFLASRGFDSETVRKVIYEKL